MHSKSSQRILAVLNERKKEEQNELLDPKWKNPTARKKKELEPEVLVKQKLIQNIGLVDPVIREGVQGALENVIYKRKNYFEVNDQFLNRITKQIEDLNASRRDILGLSKAREVREKNYEPEPIPTDFEPKILEPGQDPLVFDIKKAYAEKDFDKMDQRKSKLRLSTLEQSYKTDPYRESRTPKSHLRQPQTTKNDPGSVSDRHSDKEIFALYNALKDERTSTGKAEEYNKSFIRVNVEKSALYGKEETYSSLRAKDEKNASLYGKGDKNFSLYGKGDTNSSRVMLNTGSTLESSRLTTKSYGSVSHR